MTAKGGGGAIALLLIAIVVLIVDLSGGDEGGGPGSGRANTDSPGSGTDAGGHVTAEVLRAVDGDTIEVDIGGVEEDVRLIGVDTPETVKPGEPVGCFGPEASEFSHELLDGASVTLVFDAERRDVYGRLLAYVYIGDVFVNARLVAGGYARPAPASRRTATTSPAAGPRAR